MGHAYAMPRRAVTKVQEQLGFLISLLALLWLVEIANFLLGYRLNVFGIHPRSLFGLVGVVCAPFLHGSFGHLMANTVPLFVLGWLILLRGVDYFWQVSVFCALASGLGVWLFAPGYSVTIGASGVIFGYLGFLLLRGFYERSASAIFISLAIAFFYSGVFLGLLPITRGVSWQAHLFGFIGGILCARMASSSRRQIGPGR